MCRFLDVQGEGLTLKARQKARADLLVKAQSTSSASDLRSLWSAIQRVLSDTYVQHRTICDQVRKRFDAKEVKVNQAETSNERQRLMRRAAEIKADLDVLTTFRNEIKLAALSLPDFGPVDARRIVTRRTAHVDDFQTIATRVYDQMLQEQTQKYVWIDWDRRHRKEGDGTCHEWWICEMS